MKPYIIDAKADGSTTWGWKDEPSDIRIIHKPIGDSIFTRGSHWPLTRTYTTKYVKVLCCFDEEETFSVTGKERLTLFVKNPQKVIAELLEHSLGGWEQVSNNMWKTLP